MHKNKNKTDFFIISQKVKKESYLFYAKRSSSSPQKSYSIKNEQQICKILILFQIISIKLKMIHRFSQ